MYVINDIAYAGERKPILKITGVRPMEDYRLWARFNTGEAKVFDFKSLLDCPAFAALSDRTVFDSVYIDYGVPIWNDGDIDIAPEALYDQGITV